MHIIEHCTYNRILFISLCQLFVLHQNFGFILTNNTISTNNQIPASEIKYTEENNPDSSFYESGHHSCRCWLMETDPTVSKLHYFILCLIIEIILSYQVLTECSCHGPHFPTSCCSQVGIITISSCLETVLTKYFITSDWFHLIDL